MITVSLLEQALGELDRVAVTTGGTVVDVPVPPDVGPAVMVVKPVTDALKFGESGRLVASVDRDRTWAVHAFVLHRDVLGKLQSEQLTARELKAEVERLGIVWDVLEQRAE